MERRRRESCGRLSQPPTTHLPQAFGRGSLGAADLLLGRERLLLRPVPHLLRHVAVGQLLSRGAHILSPGKPCSLPPPEQHSRADWRECAVHARAYAQRPNFGGSTEQHFLPAPAALLHTFPNLAPASEHWLNLNPTPTATIKQRPGLCHSLCMLPGTHATNRYRVHPLWPLHLPQCWT
jgi:hypothetical protein